ncbi:MAG: hypothetical protein QXF07_00635 [Candidatus Micrarchaeia archaeon]
MSKRQNKLKKLIILGFQLVKQKGISNSKTPLNSLRNIYSTSIPSDVVLKIILLEDKLGYKS